MKTNIIRTANFILAVLIVTSVSAQNTKSYNENKIACKFSKIVKENINTISNELTNLKKAIQFKPEADYKYSGETASAEVLDLSELESAAKYYPASYTGTNKTEEISNEMTFVLDELKGIVKYEPKAEENDDMKEIKGELAVIVRYTPAS